MFLRIVSACLIIIFIFQAGDGIRDRTVTGVQTCALPISLAVVHSQGQGSIDEGTLLVRQDTVEIAREAFRLTPARAAAGGWTLATTIRFDRTRPVVVLDPILELGPASGATTLEYTVADPRDPLRIVGQFTRGRFVVRMLGR